MKTNKYQIYCVRGYETILRDRIIEKNLKRKAEIVLHPAINGHDSSQIIIFANEKIDFYDVRPRDLVNEKNNVLKKENLKLFNTKYTLVKPNVEKFYGFGDGYYPNAILPFSAAVAYKENQIESGTNQSIYVSVYIPKETPLGIYKGIIDLFIDGAKVEIPVSINVQNVVIPSENHLRSLFLTDWDWHGPNKSKDFSQYQNFTELLTRYRLSPYTLIPYPDEKELERLYSFHADLAYEYCKNPMNTTYAIPYRNWVRKKEVIDPATQNLQSEFDMGLECDVFENFLRALVVKSLKTNFNVLKKAVSHFGRFIDEPNGQKTMDRLVIVHKQYHDILNKISSELIISLPDHINKYNVTEDFIKDIADTVKAIPHIITAHYDEKYDEYIDTYCPNFWEYQKEKSFSLYEKEKEKWWYGCNGPMSPCPSYHLDDSLLSPRILSWLQFKYGYVGNLYYAVNVYDFKSAGTHNYYDLYSEILNEGSAHLDGTLAYPGEPYGLNELVTTLRLEEIRAGMEDYEILHTLSEGYKKVGQQNGLNISLKSLSDYYFSYLSRGIKIIGNYDIFENIRRIIFELYILHFESGLCIYDICENSDFITGKMIINKVFSINSQEVRINLLKNNDKIAIYEFSAESKNSEIEIYNKDRRKTFKLFPNVHRKLVSSESLIKGITTKDDVEVKMKNQGNQLVIGFSLFTEKKLINEIHIKLNEFAEFNENTAFFILNFYNDKPEDIFEAISIKAKFKNESELRDMLSNSTYLPPKRGVMPINFSDNDWKKSGKLEYLSVSFGQDSDEYRDLRKKIPTKEYINLLNAEIIEKK